MIDPKLVDKMILKHIQNKNHYTSNTIYPTFPDGMDIEIFTYKTLLKTYNFADNKFQKEHVTPFMKLFKNFKRMNVKSAEDLSHIRLTVDYKEDFLLIKKILKYFNYNIYVPYNNIISYYKKYYKNFNINKKYIRNEGSTMNSGNKLWKKAKELIPGGSMLYSKRQEVYLPNFWPTYYTKSKGCKIWDLDNKMFLDFSLMGVGTNSLGYANTKVDMAVANAIKKGNLTTLNCPEEVELAEKLIRMHPWSEMIRFTRSGGEANAVAIRIARSSTNKKKVLVCGYHGWHDWYLSSKFKNQKLFANHLPKTIKTGGIPDSLSDDIFIFKYNDFENFKETHLKNKKQIGIVKMEVSRNIPPDSNFLRSIREYCNKNNLILIFDECTSGFRETYGGLHLKYNINPDMVILGKTLGNGYAINAILGKKKIMNNANKTFISSTFWTERIGSVAALATLKEMKKIKSWEYISQKGKFVKSEWAKIFFENNLGVEISGLDAMPVFNFKNKSKNQSFKLFITKEMLKKGYLASNSFYASTAHSQKSINKYLYEFSNVIKNLKKKILNKSFKINKNSLSQINR